MSKIHVYEIDQSHYFEVIYQFTDAVEATYDTPPESADVEILEIKYCGSGRQEYVDAYPLLHAFSYMHDAIVDEILQKESNV